jgi:DNA-directed RNA polymerase specialized sigma24 family protein
VSRTADPAGPVGPAGPAGGAGGAGSSAEDALLSGLYRQVTERQAGAAVAGYDLTAGLTRYRAWLGRQTLAAGPAREAERAVEILVALHYRSLVRLASFLVGDTAAAQDLVDESFVAVHDSWGQLRDAGRALAFLRHCVVAGSRSRPYRAAAGPALAGALRGLPAPQREALVLDCYGGLTEPELAAAMGVSRWSARRHRTRALAALEGRVPAAAPGRAAAS